MSRTGGGSSDGRKRIEGNGTSRPKRRERGRCSLPTHIPESSPAGRREFMAATASAGAGFAIGRGARRSERPNLLFLWTDEQRADTMQAYGNVRISAPNLDRLASESAVIERAYVTQPVCTPSRATVLTGLLPHQTPCTENNVPLPADALCLPELLADPEYRTGYFGKWHLGDEVFAQHGFEEWESIEDTYWPYYSRERDPAAKSSYSRYLLDLGYSADTPRGVFSRRFASRLPIERCKPAFLERKACDFLRRHRSEPFLLHVNFLEPHMPFTGPLDGRYSPADVELPASFDDPLEDDEPLRYRMLRAHYQARGEEGMPLGTETDWRRLVANYWGLVTQVDASVGGILDTLEDLGLGHNTIVVFTSDHGDMMGAHRLVAKTVMYEEAVRVPWLLRAPSLGRRGRMVGGRASHVDLVPTLLDLLGRPPDPRLPGRSLVSAIRSGDRLRNDVFIEWNPETKERDRAADALVGTPQERERAASAHTRTVITPEGLKLCLSDGDKSQLFDLVKDPGETQNLFTSSAHGAVIRDLARRIGNWQRRTADRVQLPDVG